LEKKNDDNLINVAINNLFFKNNKLSYVTSLEFDSRNVVYGSAFIPLVGNRNGHSFVSGAVRNGAKLVFYDKKHKNNLY